MKSCYNIDFLVNNWPFHSRLKVKLSFHSYLCTKIRLCIVKLDDYHQARLPSFFSE